MTGVEQQMVQALADAAPPISVDNLDRLRRILAAPQPQPRLPRARGGAPAIKMRQGMQPEWRQAA